MYCLLARDKNCSLLSRKRKEKNILLQKECKTTNKVLFVKQNDDWGRCNSTIQDDFFYKDCLHLAELGNEQFCDVSNHFSS